MPGSRRPTDLTAAIPLRNATTCRRAQDDDAKHDTSPEISKIPRLDNNPTPGISGPTVQAEELPHRCLKNSGVATA